MGKSFLKKYKNINGAFSNISITVFWDDKGDLTSFPLGNSLLLLVNCNWGTKWHLLSNDNVKALCKNLVLQCVPTQHDTFFLYSC